MPRNSGKASETKFENCLRVLYGKRAYIQRFEDSSDLHGLNKRVVITSKKPSDYVVVISGLCLFAEVKSSVNPTTFSFGCIGANQLAQARLIRMAGGKYYFFVHNISQDIFYMVDSAQIDRVGKTRKSMKWSELTPWTDYEAYKKKRA